LGPYLRGRQWVTTGRWGGTIKSPVK